ncbi:unnamed protein product [Rhizoctonia solani]|uniref:BTB domain-containing protein n=1 Tax=Rhizoctonia solani TaxID=456999 RepID=A0A8H3BE47_9AGAM|nr:unnamed protein product [Rhizoctonia solani]
MSSEYKVIVQGVTFLLSEDQLSFDSPNIFTERLSAGTNDQREMRFSRNPQLFSLIHEHLCGYIILPIHENALPARMSREAALKNLRADAEYYKLQKLIGLIDASNQAPAPPEAQGLSKKEKDITKPQKLPAFFHFPGRASSFNTAWNNHPYAFMEFPLHINLLKSFTIVCWYRAMSNEGWHTLISFEVPLATRPLLYISISPEQDFRFEIGIRDKPNDLKPGSSGVDPDRLSSGPSNSKAPLHVWTHLTFTQQVDSNDSVIRRMLYSNGKELVTSDAKVHIHNPTPAQTRIVLMRGSWDRYRSAGFVGQVEDVSVFQRVLEQDEIVSRASKLNIPADHGWPTSGSWDPHYDNVY